MTDTSRIEAALDYVRGELVAYNALNFGMEKLSVEDAEALVTIRDLIAERDGLRKALAAAVVNSDWMNVCPHEGDECPHVPCGSDACLAALTKGA
ncbi:MAG: hypothetical protein WC700_14210 [Gemmatimonadaceae bacterium]